MYRIGMFLLAFTCVAALPAVDLRPDEVTITMKSGDSKVYAVFANNVDKVAVGQTMKDLKPASRLDWKRIKSLDYGTKWRGGEYSRALGAMFREDYAAAVESFLKTKDGKSQMLQVQSHRQLAEAYAGLKKYDEAIMYYFNEVIKPSVIINGNRVNVPLIYGSPERWKSVQKDGYYRDKEGKIQVPLIMFKREGLTKRRDLGNKLDANNPNLYYTFQEKFTKRNVSIYEKS